MTPLNPKAYPDPYRENFPQPRTMPDGWDCTGLLSYHLVQPGHSNLDESSFATEASTDWPPSAEGDVVPLERFPSPRSLPDSWDMPG